MRRVVRLLTAFLIALLALASFLPIVQAEEEVPAELREVGVTEKLNGSIDPALTFTDDTGRVVQLGDYFQQGRPVVLNLVYYGCPMLCGLVLKSLNRTLKEIPGLPGRDFEVVTVSIDPREMPRLAPAKKEGLLADYGREGAGAGWHLLVGQENQIKQLADQVGFHYRYDEQQQQYAHSAVTMILTAEGRVSRYLYGLEYSPRDLRLALTEAAAGKYGSTVDRFLLYCFHYDAQARSYVFFATNVMKAGGLLIVLILGTVLIQLWRREGKRVAGPGGEPQAQTEGTTLRSRLTAAPRGLLFAAPFMPQQGSTYAGEVDSLYNFILWLSLFFFFLIVGAMTYFVVRYRRGRRPEATSQISHNLTLEVTWTVIPLILVFVIFFWGFTSYMRATVAPAEALEIRVTAKKWLWEFEYPGGTRTLNEMYVPVGRPIKLIMSAEDVIHSFFLPTMRVKMDVLPNRYTTLWFEPTLEGEHQIFCTEYCGDGHSQMLGKMVVASDSKFKEWLETGGADKDTPLDQLGAKLYVSRSCNTCHSLDGSRIQGPTLKGLWGKQEKLVDGSSVLVDENYLRESLIDPKAKVVAGFEPVMPTYKGVLRDREIDALIEFIKTQK